MIGYVDSSGRALLNIPICKSSDGEYVEITAWIDTAFDGHLVFSMETIERLELESLVETEAILADGSRVTLKTFICYVDWFGQLQPVQVIANEGRFPLLGTGLLDERVLHVDYRAKTLTVE
jgi:clan AA aspartic protease